MIRIAFLVSALSLIGCGTMPMGRAAQIAALTGVAVEGGKLFASQGCAGCHGGMAQGAGSTGPALKSAAAKPSQFIGTVLSGAGNMPPYASLKDQQIADLLAWVKANAK
jgi:mono/diheme cytochrome c family protein